MYIFQIAQSFSNHYLNRCLIQVGSVYLNRRSSLQVISLQNHLSTMSLMGGKAPPPFNRKKLLRTRKLVSKLYFYFSLENMYYMPCSNLQFSFGFNAQNQCFVQWWKRHHGTYSPKRPVVLKSCKEKFIFLADIKIILSK